MRIIQLVGTRQSGKTTTAEVLIKKLKAAGFSVGTIKVIGCPSFSLDRNMNSNTGRHRQAGADVVIAAGKKETDIICGRQLTIDEMLAELNAMQLDFCIVEGGYEADLTRIVCAADKEDAEDKLTSKTICICGPLADEISEYCGLPAISAIKDADRLMELVMEKAEEMSLPTAVIKRPESVSGFCGKCSKGS